jgi:hypothetical protein
VALIASNAEVPLKIHKTKILLINANLTVIQDMRVLEPAGCGRRGTLKDFIFDVVFLDPDFSDLHY